MKSQDSRTLFLRAFTKEIILNSKPKKYFFPYHPTRPNIQENPKVIVSETPRIIPRTIEIEPKTVQVMPRAPIMSFPKRTEHIAKIQQNFPQTNIPENPAISSIKPLPQPLPQGFSMPKLNQIIRDNRVTTIECPGSGKPVLVKSLGIVAPTIITLSESEIKTIIETFSKYSRIPALEGVFKAAVGNLVLTAVISEFVGSRFIINKYTPYSLLES